MLAKIYIVNCDSLIVSPFSISLKKGDHIAIDNRLERAIVLGYGEKLRYADRITDIDRPYKIIPSNDKIIIEENDKMTIEDSALNKSMARRKKVKTK